MPRAATGSSAGNPVQSPVNGFERPRAGWSWLLVHRGKQCEKGGLERWMERERDRSETRGRIVYSRDGGLRIPGGFNS
jgi:hypothetical protein